MVTKYGEWETANLPKCPYCGKPTAHVWGRHESCHNRVHGLVVCNRATQCASNGHMCQGDHDKPHEPKVVIYDKDMNKAKLCQEKPRCCFIDVGWVRCAPVISVTCAPLITNRLVQDGDIQRSHAEVFPTMKAAKQAEKEVTRG